MTTLQRFSSLIGLLATSIVAGAQSVDSVVFVRGMVRSADGAPIFAADVFLIETLEGATTDSAGRFAIRTTRHDSTTIVARRIGFAPARRRVLAASSDLVV